MRERYLGLNQSEDYLILLSSTNSRMSPGWQFKAWQIASRVLKRIALALPVFRIERLESVNSTFSESSFNDIFLLAIITSRFTIIGIIRQLNHFHSVALFLF